MLQDKVLDNHTLDRLKRNMNITLITLERICKYPDCTPDDVADSFFLPLSEIHPEDFGLDSIRRGLSLFLAQCR